MNKNFMHLVLNALWVLILCSFDKKNLAKDAAINFQIGAIAFGDEYGNQSIDARKYRREKTYAGNIS